MNYGYSEAVTRPGSALQADRAAGGGADGPVGRFVPAEAGVQNVNGNGCRTNMSLAKLAKAQAADPAAAEPVLRQEGPGSTFELRLGFLNRILANANDICLILKNVNSYRRLDPHFSRPPNQDEVLARTADSMIRIPIRNERTTRVEVLDRARREPVPGGCRRCSTRLEARLGDFENEGKKRAAHFLPDNSTTRCKGSKYAQELLGAEVHEKYAELKLASAERSRKRSAHRAGGDPVPPRGDPVPLEPVTVRGVRGAASEPRASGVAVLRLRP